MFHFLVRLLDSLLPVETPAPTVPPAVEPKVEEEKLRAMYQLGVIAERKRLIDLGILQPDITMPSLQVIESNLKPAPLAIETGPVPLKRPVRAGGLMREEKMIKRTEARLGISIPRRWTPPARPQQTEPIDTQAIFRSMPTVMDVAAILKNKDAS